MANIALITAQTAHAAYTGCLSMLQSLGHTVTGYDSESVTAEQLDAADLIMSVREPHNASSGLKLQQASMRGKPLLIDSTDGSSTNSPMSQTAAFFTGLGSGGSITDGFVSVTALNPTFFDRAGVPTTGDIAVYPSANWCLRLFDKQNGFPMVSPELDRIAGGGTDLIAMAALWKGAKGVRGYAMRSNVGFCGFTRGDVGYTDAAKQLISLFIDDLLRNHYAITGTVTDASGNPLQRTVRLFRQSDGLFVDEVVSDAGGNFTIFVSYNTLYTAVCLDADGGLKNAVVQDDLLPVLI